MLSDIFYILLFLLFYLNDFIRFYIFKGSFLVFIHFEVFTGQIIKWCKMEKKNCKSFPINFFKSRASTKSQNSQSMHNSQLDSTEAPEVCPSLKIFPNFELDAIWWKYIFLRYLSYEICFESFRSTVGEIHPIYWRHVNLARRRNKHWKRSQHRPGTHRYELPLLVTNASALD